MPTVIVPVGLSMGPRYRYVRPPAARGSHLTAELTWRSTAAYRCLAGPSVS